LGVKVSVKEAGPCEKLLSVAVTADMIREEYDSFFQHVGREAKVPGFRPGKAPREVLESHFRSEARERVLERLISRSFRDAVGEKQIEFFGRPTIRGVEFTDEKLAYEALIEVPPPIKLRRYRGLSAVKPPVLVKPEEVNGAVERIRETLAKFVAVEDRPAAMGDFLIADYRCVVEGQEAEQRNDDWIELREEEFVKGFSEQLVGSKPGEDREVKIQFPENFGRKEWAGKEGLFKVKVKEIKTKKLPELNDELAKETGEFQTLAELHAHLERQIESEKNREAEVQYESALLDQLVKENPLEVPKGVVERRLAALLDATVQSLYRRRLRPEMIQKELPALREKLRPEAEREVRVSFLLEEIAKKEGLKPEPADWETKYKEAGARHRQPEETVRKYYEEHLEAKEALGIQILHEKAIQWIKDNAK
jgi:trigger factor